MKQLFIITLLFSLFSCENKKIKSPKGAIDIYSNVYFNASRGLDDVENIHVSKINYVGDTILELIPEPNLHGIAEKMNLIIGNKYYELGETDNYKKIVFENLNSNNIKSVFNKTNGALFSKNNIPNFNHRTNIEDTVLFGKKYKRFEIISPKTYTTIYVYKTDTILPYSIYPLIDKEYNGRVERIDSYNKEKDIFVSIQLMQRKKLDEIAEEVFAFNQFLKNNKLKH